MKFQRIEVLLQALILIGFSILIFHLMRTGNILLFISPKLIWLAKLSIILLAIIAIAKLMLIVVYSPSQICEHDHHHDHDHNCCHHSIRPGLSSSLFRYSIFIIPIVIGFTMQPQILTSTALANSIDTSGPIPFYASSNSSRSDNLLPMKSSLTPDKKTIISSSNSDSVNNTYDSSPVTASKVPNSSNSTKPPNPSSTVATKTDNQSTLVPEKPKTSSYAGTAKETDLVQLAFNIDDHPDQTFDHRWRITGFVYKDPLLAKNQFVITRYVMACCIADLCPIGIICESEDAPNLKADAWIEIEGTLKKSQLNMANKIEPVFRLRGQQQDSTIPMFNITGWKKVSTPSDPYLYP